MDTPAGYEEWIDSLPSTFDLDDGFTETARGGASSSCWTRSVTRSIDH